MKTGPIDGIFNMLDDFKEQVRAEQAAHEAANKKT